MNKHNTNNSPFITFCPRKIIQKWMNPYVEMGGTFFASFVHDKLHELWIKFALLLNSLINIFLPILNISVTKFLIF